MVTCTKCGEAKSEDQFHVNKGKPKGRTSQCKSCRQKQNRARYEAKGGYTEAQKAAIRARQNGYSDRNRKFLLDYLREHPCVTCGEDDPLVLEFDHVDPSQKKFSIGNLLHRSKLSLIEEEIKKCRVMCANCHRRHTAKQFDWWKFRQSTGEVLD